MSGSVNSGATLNTHDTTERFETGRRLPMENTTQIKQDKKQVCAECVYASAETYDLPIEWLDGDLDIGGGEYRYFKTAVDKALLLGCGADVCDGYSVRFGYGCDCACNS